MARGKEKAQLLVAIDTGHREVAGRLAMDERIIEPVSRWGVRGAKVLARTKRLIQFIDAPLNGPVNPEHHTALAELPGLWQTLTPEEKARAVAYTVQMHDMTPDIVAAVIAYLEAA